MIELFIYHNTIVKITTYVNFNLSVVRVYVVVVGSNNNNNEKIVAGTACQQRVVSNMSEPKSHQHLCHIQKRDIKH